MWPDLDKTTPEVDGIPLVELVDSCVPKTLPEHVRAEVCRNLLVSVLEYAVREENVRGHVQEQIKDVFRRYPIKYGPLSLDRPPPWSNSDRRLGETLAAGIFDG